MKLKEAIKYRENEHYLNFKISGSSEEITSFEEELNTYFQKLHVANEPFSLNYYGNKNELNVTITSQNKNHVDFWKSKLNEEV